LVYFFIFVLFEKRLKRERERERERERKGCREKSDGAVANDTHSIFRIIYTITEIHHSNEGVLIINKGISE
jgi:hypothetical protein